MAKYQSQQAGVVPGPQPLGRKCRSLHVAPGVAQGQLAKQSPYPGGQFVSQPR